VGVPWRPVFGTDAPEGALPPDAASYEAGAAVPLPGRTVLVLTAPGTENGSRGGWVPGP
jgi:isoamylase